MSSFIYDVSVVLADEGNTSSRKSHGNILILEAKDYLYPLLLNPRRPILMWILFFVVWFCVMIVCYFRYILYEYLFKQYKEKELKPIDTLTFLVAFIDQVSTTMLIIYGTIMVITGNQLQNLIGGRWACIAFIYIVTFGKGYSFIGGLMISIYRIILITESGDWLKRRLGLRNIYLIILLVGIALATSSSILESYNDYDHLRRDTCQLMYRIPIMIVLDEYEQSRGNFSIYSFWIREAFAISISRICMVVLEIMIYAIFFHHMYKHDNNELLRRLLGPNATKKRNRTNAISFFGQFCSFSIELVWIALYIITLPQDNNNGGLIVIRFFVRMVSFTCTPIIEVLTSKTLKARMYRFSLYDFIFRLK